MQLPPEERIDLLADAWDRVAETPVVTSGASTLELALRDKDDEAVVEEAVEGLASVLVTGDRDLLDAADRIPVEVLSPRGFWEKLQRQS